MFVIREKKIKLPYLIMFRKSITFQCHRPIIVKRAGIDSKGGWKLMAIFMSKAFCDWSIINMRKTNHIYQMEIYLLQYLKQYITAFVDLVYRCGSEKMSLHLDKFSMKLSSHIGCPSLGAKKW